MAAGASNHDATPLSVLVSAPVTAAAGGTTFFSRVVRGASGVTAGGAVATAGPGRALVVMVAGARLVVVVVAVAGFLVVTVVFGAAVDVVARARSSCTRSGREMDAAAAGVRGAGPAVDAESDPAKEPTWIAVDGSSGGYLRARTPPASVVRHSSAT